MFTMIHSLLCVCYSNPLKLKFKQLKDVSGNGVSFEQAEMFQVEWKRGGRESERPLHAVGKGTQWLGCVQDHNFTESFQNVESELHAIGCIFALKNLLEHKHTDLLKGSIWNRKGMQVLKGRCLFLITLKFSCFIREVQWKEKMCD